MFVCALRNPDVGFQYHLDYVFSPLSLQCGTLHQNTQNLGSAKTASRQNIQMYYSQRFTVGYVS